MVYAAQSASKEEKDRKRAEKAADAAMQNSSSEITAQVYEVVYPLYIEKIEPALIKLLTEYYAYIVAIFSKELGRSFDEVANLFDMDASNEYLTDSATDARSAVLHALQKNPDNGSVIGYAIGKGILDDELCAYGAFASEKFQYRVKEWAIHTLSKIHESSQMFNKPLVNAENKSIIKGLQKYYLAVDDNIADSKCDWQKVIRNVYGDIFNRVGATFSQLTMGCRNNGDNDYIANCVKTNKCIAISDTDKKLFMIGCNELRETHCKQIAKSLKLNLPVSIEQIEIIVESLNNIIKQLHQKQEQVSRERHEAKLKREREIAEQKRKKQERQKRTIKRVSIITLLLAIVVISGYFMYDRVIYPSSQYDEATELMSIGKYEEAISVFETLEGYKNSSERITECHTAIKDTKYETAIALMNNSEYERAIVVFEELNNYKDSSKHISTCRLALKDIAYNNAITLMNTGNNEKAVEEFKKLGDYKDCQSLIIEVSKIIAMNHEQNGDTEKAISWYKSIGDSDKVKSLMYDYVVSQKNRDNILTYDYLVKLKSSNYRDSQSIYSSLYKFEITIYIEDYDLCYIVNGGPPKGDVSIRLLNESHWNKVSVYEVTEDYTFTSSAEKEGKVQKRDIKLFYANVHRITAFDASTGEQLAQIIYD